MREPTDHVGARVPRDLKERLDAHCQATDRTTSSVIRQLIRTLPATPLAAEQPTPTELA